MRSLLSSLILFGTLCANPVDAQIVRSREIIVSAYQPPFIAAGMGDGTMWIRCVIQLKDGNSVVECATQKTAQFSPLDSSVAQFKFDPFGVESGQQWRIVLTDLSTDPFLDPFNLWKPIIEDVEDETGGFRCSRGKLVGPWTDATIGFSSATFSGWNVTEN